MSPENDLKVDLAEVLAEIDSRPFIKFVSTVITEISPSGEVEKAKAAIKLAVRCACLLDLHAETDNQTYLGEFKKQRTDFYGLIPDQHQQKLRVLEGQVMQFFEEERLIMDRVRSGDRFSEENIREYLLGKSSDNLFYGKVIEVFIPEWDLTEELRIQTVLFDIGKDIKDYEEDIRDELPNVIYMVLSSEVDKGAIPRDEAAVMGSAIRTGASNRLLGLASDFKDRALGSERIKTSPTLEKAINDRFKEIIQLLGKLRV